MSDHGIHPGGLVVDTGIDVVAIDRVAALLERRPNVLSRLLLASEQERLRSVKNPSAFAASVAARLAAKEAVMKALGGGIWDLGFLSVEVEGGRDIAPSIRLHGKAQRRAVQREIDMVKISLSHDGGIAIASATALRWCPCAPS